MQGDFIFLRWDQLKWTPPLTLTVSKIPAFLCKDKNNNFLPSPAGTTSSVTMDMGQKRECDNGWHVEYENPAADVCDFTTDHDHGYTDSGYTDSGCADSGYTD